MQMLINIIAEPNLLLLDEPLTSLDVVVAEEMKQLLRNLKDGRIIIFSTHIINLVPAVVIGLGLVILLFSTGGTDNPLNYIVTFVSMVALSIFFSVHYLMLYYLLQPYNAGTEMKSGTYQLIVWVTYIVCPLMNRLWSLLP